LRSRSSAPPLLSLCVRRSESSTPGTDPLSLHDALPICWGIPAFCDYQGKAIYMDTDMIVLCDLAELWNLEFEPGKAVMAKGGQRSEEHTSELQSRENLVCRLLLEKKNCKLTISTIDWNI